MSDEQVDLETAVAFLDMGHKYVRFFEAGPAAWALLPQNRIDTEHISDYLGACLMNENASAATVSDTRRHMMHQYVDALVDAFDEWAKDTGREDLLLTVGERLAKAVQP